MIKEEKIEFTTKWCKYSKYKIVEKDDKLYVLPEEKSVPSTYDPFVCANEILKDILVIGKEISEAEVIKSNEISLEYEILSKRENLQNLILNFVNKYGTLGMFRYWPENFEFMDKPKHLVKSDSGKYLSAKEFEKKYFEFDAATDWDKKPFCMDYTRLAGLDENFKQTEGDRLNDIIFSKYYAETIPELLHFASLLYAHKELITAYYHDNSEKNVKGIYADIIDSKRIEKVEFGYTLKDGKIKFEWVFFSLAAIIETMLLLNETNGRNEVKLCKFCGKPFIAKNIKSEYDTPQCRNKANIYKSRNRNK